MVISAIGDSLTEGDYGVKGKTGIANVHSENYPYYLGKLLNCEVRNYGKCGFAAHSYLNYYEQGNVDVKGSDMIVIMLGTNGGFDDEAETDGNRDFEKLISLIKNDEPNAKIILCTPPHCTENPEYSNCGYIARVEKAQQYIRKFAKEHNFKLIDVGACGLFTAENENIYQANDGLHFVKAGYEALAKYISENL